MRRMGVMAAMTLTMSVAVGSCSSDSGSSASTTAAPTVPSTTGSGSAAPASTEPSSTDSPTTEAATTVVPTTTATALPTTTAAPTTTLPPVPELPAGGQFLSRPTPIPRFFTAQAANEVATVGISQDQVVVDSGGATQVIALPQPASPSGFPLAEGTTTATAIAAGSAGFVIVGGGRFRVSGTGGYTIQPAIWHSVDGLSWTLDDLGPLGAGSTIALSTVRAIPNGFVTLGAIGDRNSPRSSSALLLTSADGVTWTQGAVPTATWSLGLNGLDVDPANGRALLIGIEYVCAPDGGALAYTGPSGLQLHVYESTDAMASWQLIDLTPSGMLTGAEPPPADASGCPTDPDPGSLTPHEERDRRFTEMPGLTILDHGLLISSAAGFARTTDLVTWTPGTLPQDAAAPRNGADPDPPVAVHLTALDGVPGGLQQISLELRRDDMNQQIPREYRSRVHRSTDGGKTWELMPGGGRSIYLGRSVTTLVGGDTYTVLTEFPDGSGEALRYDSVAGPLDATSTTCTPGPNADCFDMHLVDVVDESGADLAGIDLRGSTTDANYSNASLVGAQLTAASLTYADMTGADLSNADARYAIFNETLLSSKLVGARLGHARIYWSKPTPTSVDLTGLDLSGLSIGTFSSDGSKLPLVITAAAFANLSGAAFDAVDLTGSNLAGAVLDNIFFGSNVICPDGLPGDTALFGARRCRL